MDPNKIKLSPATFMRTGMDRKPPLGVEETWLVLGVVRDNCREHLHLYINTNL